MILGGCGGNAQIASLQFEGTLHIARQHSIMYAPVYVMQELGLLEQYLPGMEIEWSVFGSGAAINEALAANRLDIAFMGISPAIIAWDRGIEARIFTGLCVAPAGLQVSNDTINSLADFTVNDRIALPNLGSIQHILLSMASERELGDARALDNNIVAMTHPDGAMALISGSEISAHFTALPFMSRQNNEGFKTILTGTEAFGSDFSTIVGIAANQLQEQNPIVVAAIFSALSDAMVLINQRDEHVIEIISRIEGISEDEVMEYLSWEGTNFTTTLYGIEGMAEFMYREGYISNNPNLEGMLQNTALSAIGSRVGIPSVLETAQERTTQ